MHSRKAGIELSSTFLVGMILGIIMLSLGLLFVYKIMDAGDKLEPLLPDYFEQEAQACVARDDALCIPITKAEVETQKTASFGAIINNNLDSGTHEFKILVKFSRGLLDDEEETRLLSDDIDASDWTYDDYIPMVIENNEHEIIGIPLRPPKNTAPGTYVFNIYVCYDGPASNSECISSHNTLFDVNHQVTVVVE